MVKKKKIFQMPRVETSFSQIHFIPNKEIKLEDRSEMKMLKFKNTIKNIITSNQMMLIIVVLFKSLCLFFALGLIFKYSFKLFAASVALQFIFSEMHEAFESYCEKLKTKA